MTSEADTEHSALSAAELDPVFEPEAIERRSMEIIDSLVPEPRPFEGAQWAVARRMVHTTADFELLDHVRFHPHAVLAGLTAIRAGASIVTDTRMAAAGIPPRRLEPFGCRVLCLMNDPEVAHEAKRRGLTRAHVAVERAASLEGPVIWAVGNAPTALLRLLDLLDAGRVRPALIVGMPVGFVNAEQSKDLLMARTDIPWIAIEGRKGGSALAACTVNALAELALSPPSSVLAASAAAPAGDEA